MAKTTTTVREYDDEGRMVKETVTVTDSGGYVYPYVIPTTTNPYPTIPYKQYPYTQYPYTVWNGVNTQAVNG